MNAISWKCHKVVSLNLAQMGYPVDLVGGRRMYRGCVITAVAMGLIPPCGPLLHVISSLSTPFPVQSVGCPINNKGTKAPKISKKQTNKQTNKQKRANIHVESRIKSCDR